MTTVSHATAVVTAAAAPAVLLAAVWPATPTAVVLFAGLIPVGLASAAVAHRATARRHRDLALRHAELQGTVAGLSHRLAVVSDVIDATTRRAWEPTLKELPNDGVRPVALLPGADYHLPELVAIARSLEARGVPTRLVCGRPHWARVVRGLAWYPDLQIFELPEPQQVDRFQAVVTMKDWAGYGPLIDAARAAGVPTLAKVEGVQDFHALDTPTDVRPYRHAAIVLCQGENDRRELSTDREGLAVVGSSRLEALWRAPAMAPGRALAVINLNFTGGVLASERMGWLRSATAACEAADLPFVISLHPAERIRDPHPRATSIGVSRLLEHATVLISRFSTAPFEAMSRGVPFIYHNPHGEQVQTFAEPDGAFEVSTDTRTLTRALAASQGEAGAATRERTQTFFLSQVDVDLKRAPGDRAADVIIEQL